MRFKHRSDSPLKKKARRGFRGYPVATVTFYGPTDFVQRHGVSSVATTDRIIGCPHEEGIDYPDGEVRPQSPFWANRNRWTGETVE